MTSAPNGPSAAGSVTRLFPARPTVLREIRRFVLDQATANGIAARDLDTILLAVHETAANAIEHSGGETVQVQWERADGAVHVTIRDDGVFEPGGHSAEDRGRGLKMLFALADWVQVRPGRPEHPGTVVRLRFPVDEPTTDRPAVLLHGHLRALDVESARATLGTAEARCDAFGCVERTASGAFAATSGPAPRRPGRAVARAAESVVRPTRDSADGRPPVGRGGAGRGHRSGPPAWLDAARRTLLDNIPVGFAVLDDQLRYVQINQVLAQINGVPAAMHLGHTLREMLPEFPPMAEELFGKVIATGNPLRHVEFSSPVPGTSGDMRHWMGNVYPVPGPDGVPVGVAVVVIEVTEARRSRWESAARQLAEEHARRTHVLQQLTAALAAAVDTTQVAQVVTSTVAELLGATVGTIADLDEHNRCRLVAATGLSKAAIARMRAVPTAEAGNPVDTILRSRQPLLISCRADWDQRFPRLRGVQTEQEAMAVLPLLADGVPTGIVTFGWSEPRDFTPDDIDLLVAVAGQTANALQRARLFDAERRARTAAQRAQCRLALLAEVSVRLAAASTEDEQLAGLADLLVERFADCCSVLLPDDTGRLRRRIMRAATPAFDRIMQGLVGTVMTDIGDEDVRTAAWRTGRVGRETVSFASYAATVDPSVADALAGTTETCSTMAVPLTARGHTFGLFNVWRDARRPPFDSADEQLLADLGHRAAMAIDNTRLLAARTHVAARLQASLLPDRLPDVPGIELAASYLAAEDAADVGGDLYDAFGLPDGTYALLIGDVTGRGIDAADLTGITRATLRALAGHLPVPAALAHLNALLAERTSGERFLTLAYLLLRLDPDGQVTVRTWLAGHPPPYLIRPDGGIGQLGTPGPLLGVFPKVTHVEHTCRLAPGDLILLYTDGLTEARNRGGMFADTCLPTLLPTLANHTAADTVTRVEQALLDHRRDHADDTALLAARLTPAAEPAGRLLVDLRLPADPAFLADARHTVTAVAGPLLSEAAYPLVVAVNELLTNAIKQVTTSPPRSPRPDPIRLRLIHRGPLLRVEVANPGPRFALPEPPADPTRPGRGLRLVRAVATGLGVTTVDGTTCVWFETPCPAG